jgi:hypothetical protein
MPGWRSAELLRLSHDVELMLRNFARFSSRRDFRSTGLALCSLRGESRRAVHEVGRGVGQGYFAYGAGGCGFDSHLVQFGGQ